MPPVQAKRPLSDWFRRWRSPLRKFLVAKGAIRVADLDDISQEVFLRLLRYDSAEVIEHPQAYLQRVAANVAAEWAVRASHRLDHDPRWLDALVADSSLEDQLDRAVVQREIKNALMTLSPRERSVLRLHFEEGQSYSEIAAHLGLTLRIVRRDFESSFRKLRGELKGKLTGALSHGRE
jgi:RNA polymerase sigma factor (sigma-70 family)